MFIYTYQYLFTACPELVHYLFTACTDFDHVPIILQIESFDGKMNDGKKTKNFNFKIEYIISFLSGLFSGFLVFLQEFSCHH